MRALRPTAHRGLHVDPPGLVDRGGHPDDALQPPRHPAGTADADAASRVLLEGDAAGADSKARRALHHIPHRGGRLHLRPAGPAAEDPDEGGGRRRKGMVVPGRDVHRFSPAQRDRSFSATLPSSSLDRTSPAKGTAPPRTCRVIAFTPSLRTAIPLIFDAEELINLVDMIARQPRK